jgi:hypothetical protein
MDAVITAEETTSLLPGVLSEVAAIIRQLLSIEQGDIFD